MSDESNQNSDPGEEFVSLLVEHEPKVKAFLRGLLPSWNDVDEVIQEASLVAWRKYHQFEPGTAFGGWFLTIARFEALKHRRKIARTPLVFSNDVWELLAEEAAKDAPAQTRRQHLESCLSELQPHQREVILKVHSPGVVIRDVAEAAGKSEQAFYKVVQRLRSALHQCVSKSLAAEGVS